METQKEIIERWNKFAAQCLWGKTIKSVSYMSDEEQANAGFLRKALVIEFTDGTLVYPSMDDEGNDAGALFGMTSKGEEFTIPVI